MNICRGHTHTHCGYIYIHACPLYGWTLHVAFVKCGIIYDTFITLTTSGGGWRQIPEKGGIRKRKKCVSTQLFVKVALSQRVSGCWLTRVTTKCLPAHSITSRTVKRKKKSRSQNDTTSVTVFAEQCEDHSFELHCVVLQNVFRMLLSTSLHIYLLHFLVLAVE